ncbi:hypothetical protein JI435_415320 [Parastagonospora nodorum SN15]|uniref:Uncharacterized protein n=1 Tax=Phaeosphaeria nodorum (strain SN15 / ATCC MYA-4574 / FGSC 10173) TaxID=321614 RepID=A0A7U2I5F4_PHANO|nr:hypothetical protein JI435_415320 [Parastagonospora nodorum SN15]
MVDTRGLLCASSSSSMSPLARSPPSFVFGTRREADLVFPSISPASRIGVYEESAKPRYHRKENRHTREAR